MIVFHGPSITDTQQESVRSSPKIIARKVPILPAVDTRTLTPEVLEDLRSRLSEIEEEMANEGYSEICEDWSDELQDGFQQWLEKNKIPAFLCEISGFVTSIFFFLLVWNLRLRGLKP